MAQTDVERFESLVGKTIAAIGFIERGHLDPSEFFVECADGSAVVIRATHDRDGSWLEVD